MVNEKSYMFADKKIFREYKRIKITDEDIERIKSIPKKGFKHPNETWKSIVSAKSAYEAFMKRDDVQSHATLKNLCELYREKIRFSEKSTDKTVLYSIPAIIKKTPPFGEEYRDMLREKNVTDMNGTYPRGIIFSMFNKNIKLWQKNLMAHNDSGLVGKWQEMRRNLNVLYELLHLELTALKIYRKQVYNAKQAGQTPPNPPGYLNMTKEEREKIMKPRQPNPPAPAGEGKKKRRRGRGKKKEEGEPAGESRARSRSKGRPANPP